MPGIKELEKFTIELHKIAGEPEVTARWGEKYEEIPLPKDAPIPDINIDDLLSNTEVTSEIENSNDDTNDMQPAIADGMMPQTEPEESGIMEDDDLLNMDLPQDPFGSEDDPIAENADASAIETKTAEDIPEITEFSNFLETEGLDSTAPNSLDGISSLEEDFLNLDTETLTPDKEEREIEEDPLEVKPVQDAETIQTGPDHERKSAPEYDIEAEADKTFDEMTAEASTIKQITDEKEVSLFTEGPDAEEIETSQENTSEFGGMLSNLNLEAAEHQSGEELDSQAPDVPEALLTGLGDMVEDARKTEDKTLTSFPDFSIDEPLPDDSEEPDTATAAETDEADGLGLGDIEEAGFQIPDISNIETSQEDSPENDIDFDMPDIKNIGEPENNFSESASEISNMEPESLDEPEALDETEGLTSEEPEAESIEEFGPSSELDMSPEISMNDASSQMDFDEPISDEPEEIDLSGFDEVPDGEHAHESTPSENFTMSETDMPALDEHTAFAIDDNVLNTEMGAGMDEFSIPESFTQFSPDKKFKIADTKKSSSDEGYDGKIPLSISEADYDKFISRVSSFPLNVRLEIQDYLINGDDSELNKMEVVHLIVNDVSLKKIASKLESILDKPIPIPKGFDKKSYDEYEKQKKSFKYKLIYKILPAAILGTILSALILSLGILSWQFIYKPFVAEGIYRDGFYSIENGQYENAITRFDEAGKYKKKRKWYFQFANAFRMKKQFLSAESIYKRLLFDFKHDKQGGIEYADMLSRDLRNYEKAEEVLKRDVLDYHINDPDALLALGDVYLDWADEQNEKYTEAKKTYVSLINTYGEKDVFMGRMMRYFIRTDNLAEVLPLKDLFLDKNLDKDDLIELSGYLLEKRYEPKPSDSDKLRARIEDVRELLEKALKADSESPEANYNMGRFFNYNRKPDASKQYLQKAIGLYENSGQMTPKRLIRQLDSMRLYGNLLSNDKRYNEAQEVYANALSKYGDYTSQKLIYPSEIVGKLYEGYGDILYFISRNSADNFDYDAALDAYENAVKELNNTPSIQYKIGYIHYKKENYIDAMKAMTLAYAEKPNDKNLLYGFGSVLFKRGNYFASQTYYERLMEILEAERLRKGIIFPQTRSDHAKLVEDYMHTANNLGVVLNRIAAQNGDSKKNGRAIALFGESSRAWDSLTRNQETMIRSKPVNLAYANIQNVIKPLSIFEPEIYSDIPKTLENEKVLQQLEDR